MLTLLQIRDFAIVEAVELEFARGYTVLTGETGAGKSILVDALMLVVGGRADSGAVRHGAERAEIAAGFDLEGNAGALAWLAEQEIAHEGEVLLRRSVGGDGRSRAYVNGQAVPVQSLRALGEHLVDVHGQLEFQSLVRRSYQRVLLDESGRHGAAVEAMRAAWRHWRDLAERRRSLEQSDADRDRRIELLSHYVAELEALDAKPAEARELAEERRRIGALGRLAEGTAQVEALLAGDGADVTAALGRAHATLRQLAGLDSALGEPARLVDEAAISCREALVAVRRYADGLEADPARQEWIEARLAALESAARKHRVAADELPGLRERLEAELDALRSSEVDLVALDRQLAAAVAERNRAAERLREARRLAATALDERVTDLMQGLGMPGGIFVTRVTPLDPGQCAEHGADDVVFEVSANPGQPSRPLAKVASGGELSRISLALQVATLESAHLPCLVFDEVDAGVGGAVAEMVGRQLRRLATAGQVLCVTHLAQVACQADRQVRVSKRRAAGSTKTAVEALEGEARVEEIARMLGGTTITERTREHAREMLEASRTRAKIRPAASGKGSPRARSGRAG
ncbi:MAG: DNA repair protein RecN [Lysobacterales bacterium]|jgi:DNA repair protein RecN (Recombination protein N)|nr:MAG: DNA repair protein RecN [Xanthomonadales bacterium]